MDEPFGKPSLRDLAILAAGRSHGISDAARAAERLRTVHQEMYLAAKCPKARRLRWNYICALDDLLLHLNQERETADRKAHHRLRLLVEAEIQTLQPEPKGNPS